MKRGESCSPKNLALRSPRSWTTGAGPEAWKLDELFASLDVDRLDPANDDRRRASKATRVERVLVRSATEDTRKAWDVFLGVIESIRAKGGFRSGSEHHPGHDAVRRLSAVLARDGYDISDDGIVRATVFENVDAETAAAGLRITIERARRCSEDPPVVVASAKEFVEGAARLVVRSTGGTYHDSENFADVVKKAFTVLGLSVPQYDRTSRQYKLEGNEWSRLVEAMYVLACELNRFRNEHGLGHGRPEEPSATSVQARVAAEAAGAVGTVLLDLLDLHRASQVPA